MTRDHETHFLNLALYGSDLDKLIYSPQIAQARRQFNRRVTIRASLAIVGILILVWIMEGCAPAHTVKGYCVPESIYSAWTWEARTKQPARIAVSRIAEGIDHAQAQGWTGKGWIYLTSLNGEVKEWQPHFEAVPYRFVELNQWIEEQEGKR